MRSIALALSGLFLASLAALAADPAPEFKAAVTEVLDGDTLKIKAAGRTQTVRLGGVDAPEQGQPFHKVAQEELEALVGGKSVRVKIVGVDDRGVSLARILYGNKNINSTMVRIGMAWHDVKRAPTDKLLADSEAEARENHLGIWQDQTPVAPWDWRQRAMAVESSSPDVQSTSSSTKPTVEEKTVYVTDSGEKYHSAGCRHLRKSKIAMPLSKAKEHYEPCKVCNPPR